MDISDLLEINLITCNRKEKLRNTLNTILDENSPVKDLEIQIINNDSTDGSSELIDSYCRKYKNIKHIKNTKNIGGNANITKAYAIAKKKYVWVLCDDDTYNWKAWNEVEQALLNDYDVIFTRKIEKNKDNTPNTGSIFCVSTFVPACIYKTENITPTVIFNMYNNIPNFFPHLAITAKNINEHRKFYYISSNIVEIGPNTDGYTTYYRDMSSDSIPESFKNTFWSIGYYCSTELISDPKIRSQIINNPVYPYKTLFLNFCNIIFLNMGLYNNYFFNYCKIFRLFNLKQKLIFIAAFLKISLLSLFFNYKRTFLKTEQDHIDYVCHKNTKKHIKKLLKKLKDKKVLIYGAGRIADKLFEFYDFSSLNIVGVADRRFNETEINEIYGYKAVKTTELLDKDYDVILFTVLNPEKIIEDMHNNGIKKTAYSVSRKILGFII